MNLKFLVLFCVISVNLFAGQSIDKLFLKNNNVLSGQLEIIDSSKIKFISQDNSRYFFNISEIIKSEKIYILNSRILDSKNVSIENYDLLYLKNGSIIKGEIELVSSNSLKIKSLDGVSFDFDLNSVNKSMKFNTSSMKFNTSNIIDSNSNKIDHAEIGLLVGTPGGVNVAFGYLTGSFKPRITFGYGYEVMGMQLDLGYKVYSNNDIYMMLSLPIGFMGEKSYLGDERIKSGGVWLYTGLLWQMNYKNIDFGLGLCVGPGIWSSPSGLFHLGYVYQLN